MLSSAVQRFANDIQIISENIKMRTVGQIKGALQKRAYNDAGIVVQQIVIIPRIGDQSPIWPTFGF